MFSSSIEKFIILLFGVIGGLVLGVPRLDGMMNGSSNQGESEQTTENSGESSEQTAPDAVEETDTAEAEAEAEAPEMAAEPPSVDTMRFDGQTGVVSGLGLAGAKIIVRDGDKVIGETTADANGNFATTFDYEIPAEGGILQLSMVDENGNEIPAEQALTVMPLDTGEAATATLTEDGVEVDAPEATGLALGEMQYGSATPWVLGGTALPGAVIDLFVNGEKIGSTTADDNGVWNYQGEGIAPGTYELGLSQNGEAPVTQSITLQDAPTETAQSGGGSTGSGGAAGTSDDGRSVTIGDREYVVRRGDSLWRIAERFYGEGQGHRYTEIFDVNSSQIRNPDLIYPQQEFEIPKEN